MWGGGHHGDGGEQEGGSGVAGADGTAFLSAARDEEDNGSPAASPPRSPRSLEEEDDDEHRLAMEQQDDLVISKDESSSSSEEKEVEDVVGEVEGEKDRTEDSEDGVVAEQASTKQEASTEEAEGPPSPEKHLFSASPYSLDSFPVHIHAEKHRELGVDVDGEAIAGTTPASRREEDCTTEQSSGAATHPEQEQVISDGIAEDEHPTVEPERASTAEDHVGISTGVEQRHDAKEPPATRDHHEDVLVDTETQEEQTESDHPRPHPGDDNHWQPNGDHHQSQVAPAPDEPQGTWPSPVQQHYRRRTPPENTMVGQTFAKIDRDIWNRWVNWYEDVMIGCFFSTGRDEENMVWLCIETIHLHPVK